MDERSGAGQYPPIARAVAQRPQVASKRAVTKELARLAASIDAMAAKLGGLWVLQDASARTFKSASQGSGRKTERAFEENGPTKAPQNRHRSFARALHAQGSLCECIEPIDPVLGRTASELCFVERKDVADF